MSKTETVGYQTVFTDPFYVDFYDPDHSVTEVFPDADAVNEALRFLIRITRENQVVPSVANKGT